MRYSKDQRVDIGGKVFRHELTKEAAAAQYRVTQQTVSNYVNLYMRSGGSPGLPAGAEVPPPGKDYSSMTREELIGELMLKDIEVARAKKGYAVKGGGKEKEFVSIRDASSK